MVYSRAERIMLGGKAKLKIQGEGEEEKKIEKKGRGGKIQGERRAESREM